MGKRWSRLVAAASCGFRLGVLCLSSGLVVACVALWARDWHRPDGGRYQKWTEGITGFGGWSWVGWTVEVRSFHGCMRVEYQVSRYDRTLDPSLRVRLDQPGAWFRHVNIGPARQEPDLAQPPDSVWAQLGFAYIHTYDERPSGAPSGSLTQITFVSLTAPHWAVALLCAGPLLGATAGRRRRRRRVAAGHCGRCDYDLRGGSTNGRCPECGMPLLMQWTS